MVEFENIGVAAPDMENPARGVSIVIIVVYRTGYSVSYLFSTVFVRTGINGRN